MTAQIPDAPINLSNVAEVTDATTIGLQWESPLFDGGSNVIDYRLLSDDASNGATFIVVLNNYNSYFAIIS